MREVDIADRIQAQLADTPPTVKGSMGQEVASPLIMEIRQHRVTLAMLLKRLRLPCRITKSRPAHAPPVLAMLRDGLLGHGGG